VRLNGREGEMTIQSVRRAVLGLGLGSAVAAGVLLTGGSAGAAPAPAKFGVTQGAPLLATTTTAVAATPNRPRFYHEPVKVGARDVSPTSIAHVYEVQLRLYRLGLYGGLPVNGIYGTPVAQRVRAFQKQQKLPQTGNVDQATWSRLIDASARRSWGWTTMPAVCRSAGFHSCYSRYTYELFFFSNGTLWNSWMVRGGAAGLQTVTGTYRVYWQDIDHRSSAFNNAPMPYSQFFYGGEAIHGSYTMVDPRKDHSHGCINMYIEDAAELWKMTVNQRNTVTVYGPWR
jgi:putative peptidoglycan binding protein/L,D-transpeptidase-like protein